MQRFVAMTCRFLSVVGGMALRECDRPLSVEGSEELAEFRGRLELRNGVEDFERGGEGVCEAPESAGSELLVLRVEVVVVDFPHEMSWGFEVAFDERPVDHELRLVIR